MSNDKTTVIMMDEQTTEINSAYSEADRAMLARVTEWINPEAGRDQATLGRLTGMKAGTLSQVVTGKYPTSPTKWLTLLVDAVERWQERQRAGESSIPLCRTETFNRFSKIIARAHRDRDFGCIFARVGTGKTTAIMAYAERGSAVVLEAFDGIDHSTVVAELVEATGVKIDTKATQSAKVNAVIKRLKGSDKVILVDEAGWLPDRSLGALRRISDVAKVGVVLAGTPDLEIRIADPDGRFGQITSRTGFWPPVLKEVPANDLVQMARAYLEASGVEAGEEALGQFATSAKGSARLLEKLLRGVLRAARSGGKAITGGMVAEIYNTTFRGV
jgi:DNA transposition AAA+ family ATPase